MNWFKEEVLGQKELKRMACLLQAGQMDTRAILLHSWQANKEREEVDTEPMGRLPLARGICKKISHRLSHLTHENNPGSKITFKKVGRELKNSLPERPES
jgi:hypothetical protein